MQSQISCILLADLDFDHRYETMKKCWEMEPEKRPTFSELYANITKYIERIAGYLDLGFNPFPGVGGGETIAEKDMEGKKEKGCDPEAALHITSTPEALDNSSEHPHVSYLLVL